MVSTLPQRIAIRLLANPDIAAAVDGRVLDQDYRLTDEAILPGVLPNTTVEARNLLGQVNPLIVVNDQGELPSGLGGGLYRAMRRVGVWLFWPRVPKAQASILALRDLVIAELHGSLDLLPGDARLYAGEGSCGFISRDQVLGTLNDDDAFYEQITFTVATVLPEP